MVSVTQAISLAEGAHDYAQSVEIFRSFVAEKFDNSPATSDSSSIVVDLHGYNQILARAAIRSALERILEKHRETRRERGRERKKEVEGERYECDSLVIITGIGKNSKVGLYIIVYIFCLCFNGFTCIIKFLLLASSPPSSSFFSR